MTAGGTVDAPIGRHPARPSIAHMAVCPTGARVRHPLPGARGSSVVTPGLRLRLETGRTPWIVSTWPTSIRWWDPAYGGRSASCCARHP